MTAQSSSFSSPDSSGGRAPVGRRLLGIGLAVVLAGGVAVMGAGAVALYGIGWSERRLEPVRLGMTGAEVRAVAGEPRMVSRDDRGGQWSYTRWWSADADVYFDGAGRVRAVVTD
jgi:hypothetical protein